MPHARIVRYADLRQQPKILSQALFDFTGLDWQPQTVAFVAASTSGRRSSGYYDVSPEREYRRLMARQHVGRRSGAGPGSNQQLPACPALAGSGKARITNARAKAQSDRTDRVIS